MPNVLMSARLRNICLLLATLPCAAAAQEDPLPSSPQVTSETIAAARQSVEKNQEIDEALRTRVLELYTKATAEMTAAGSASAELAGLQQEAKAAPERLRTVRNELASPPAAVEEPPPGDSLAKVQQTLTSLEADLSAAKLRKTELSEKAALRAQRRVEVPGLIEETRKTIKTVDAELGTKPDPDEPRRLTQAKRMLLQARLQNLRARAALLEQELPTYDATGALLTAESDLAERRVSQIRKSVNAWQEIVNQRRRTEAENHLREAQGIESSVARQAQPLAQDVVELARGLVTERRKLAGRIASTLAGTQRIEAETKRLAIEFSEITERAEAAGFTNAVGVLLQKQRSALPNVNTIRDSLREHQLRISEAHIQRIEFRNQRSAISDVETQIESQLAAAGRLTDSEKEKLGEDFRRIFQARLRYLDGVIQDLSSYLDRLATLDTRERTLLTQTEDQSKYIAEHILWVRSTTPIGRPTFDAARSSGAWLSAQFPGLGQCLAADAVKQWTVWVAGTLVFCVLILGHQRLRQRLHAIGELASRRNTTAMKPTMLALGLTVAAAAAWPVLLGFLGWRLTVAAGDDQTLRAAGEALRGCALLLLTLDILRQSCRTDGLGIAHFDWPARTIGAARKPLRLILLVVVPLAFVVLFLERTENDAHRTSLGRLALITSLMVVAVACHRVLKPANLADEVPGRSNWLRRLRYGWYALGVGVPVVLSALAGLGYLYSARQLARRLVESGWLLLIVVLLSSLLARWQLLTYRALAMKQARKRREDLLQSGQADGEINTVSLEDQTETLSESNQKLAKLQTILFVGITIFGLGLIWNDVLPALGFLGKIRLWESGIASEVINGVEKHEWVTMRELLLAVAVVALTLFASRNLPGLLEFAVLQRLPVDAGFKYAISAVFRYLITTIGVVFAFRMIGVGWSNVQWLVAAMTVGLGFGLQEIFANFVSGLILLFERPIRVGDTVTVGTVTGTVTRIRIRATTIVDWDRKELVVPNREFVTGQLVNWTLSDTVLRIVIRVGVAYGTDTRLATRLLREVAAQNSDVLDDPTPLVIFNAFGESSLDFELRCFVSTLHGYRTIAHELNIAIDDAFRKHGIEIAFPQRDLHLRSADAPLSIHERGSAGGGPEEAGFPHSIPQSS